MLSIQLALSAISVFIYLLFNSSGWLRQVRNKCGGDTPRRSYFVGLLFAGLYYNGFPIWWWRYGLKNATKLLLACIIAGAICQAILRVTGMIEVHGLGESFVISMLIAVPIRAIAGTWVARHDERWSGAIKNVRKNKSWPMVERLKLSSERLKKWRTTAYNRLSGGIFSRWAQRHKDGKRGTAA